VSGCGGAAGLSSLTCGCPGVSRGRAWFSEAEPVSGAVLKAIFKPVQLLNRPEGTCLDLRPLDSPFLACKSPMYFLQTQFSNSGQLQVIVVF